AVQFQQAARFRPRDVPQPLDRRRPHRRAAPVPHPPRFGVPRQYLERFDRAEPADCPQQLCQYPFVRLLLQPPNEDRARSRVAARDGGRDSAGGAGNASSRSATETAASAPTAATSVSRSSGGTRGSPSRRTIRSTSARSESASAVWSIAASNAGSCVVVSK